MSFPGGVSPIPKPDLEAAIAVLRRRWPWIVAFGVFCSLLGVVALALVGATTLASVYLIAIFIIVVGGSEIALAINSHVWSNRILLVLVGLLYIIVGSFALANPLTGAAGFTLMLGASLFATGVLRMYFGAKLPHGPSGYVIFAGVITTLLGLLILFGWPENSIFVLGLFLGVDLLFYGASWVAFGLSLRKS
jgi:uncharacterized membrane protein HdeD (DUF308 family)